MDDDGLAAGDRAADARSVAVCTTDPVVEHAVRRVVAATGRDVEVIGPEAVLRAWRTAALVLVGADVVADVAIRQPARRSGVLVVAAGHVADDVWRGAVGLAAEEVLVLPEADTWLVERLGQDDVGDAGRRAGAPVVGVVGGRGGAGATFLAAALVRCAATVDDDEVVLVDLDPLGGGADLVLGPRDEAGLRWADLADVRGRVPWSALAGLLPRIGGVDVVTFGRGAAPEPPPEASVRSVVDAARTGSGLVVVDLPRTAARASDVLHQLDVAIVVTTADVRGSLAARSVCAALRGSLDEVVVGVRRPVRGGLPTHVVQEVVGASEVVDVPELRGADRRVDRGRAAFGSAAAWRPVLQLVRGSARVISERPR